MVPDLDSMYPKAKWIAFLTVEYWRWYVLKLSLVVPSYKEGTTPEFFNMSIYLQDIQSHPAPFQSVQIDKSIISNFQCYRRGVNFIIAHWSDDGIQIHLTDYSNTKEIMTSMESSRSRQKPCNAHIAEICICNFKCPFMSVEVILLLVSFSWYFICRWNIYWVFRHIYHYRVWDHLCFICTWCTRCSGWCVFTT